LPARDRITTLRRRGAGDWVAGVMADSDQFFTPPPTDDYTSAP
jgi:hypothetical protein